MPAANNVHSIDTLIDKPIISRATGNKLGRVHDLIVDPIKGVLLGLSTQLLDGSTSVIGYGEIYSVGPDAVIVNDDDSMKFEQDSALSGMPLAKKNIAGAKIITDGGKLLGQVANVYVHTAAPPLVMYEVRESLLDKLLGRALFIPASAGRAVSEGTERIVVPDDTTGYAADSLEALMADRIAPLTEESAAGDRRDLALGAFKEGTIEVIGTVEEPVVSKQARVVEEVVVGKDVQERTETIRDTVRRTDVDVEQLDTDTKAKGRGSDR